MRLPTGRTMLKLTGALMVVVCSFWVTIKILDYWGTSEESNGAPVQPTYDLTALPRVDVGQTVEFGVGKDNRALLLGWAGPEPGGIWSLGKNSAIGFTVHCEPAVCNSGHPAVYLEAEPFAVEKHPQQVIVFWMGTKRLSKVTLTSGKSFAVNLDGVTVKDGSPIILSLQLPNAIAPANITNSKDTREIAFRIKSLRFAP